MRRARGFEVYSLQIIINRVLARLLKVAYLVTSLCNFGPTVAVDLLLNTHVRLVFVLIRPQILSNSSLLIGYLNVNAMSYFFSFWQKDAQGAAL